MFFHKKEPIHAVNVNEPNPRFAQLLLEQFGGATGELTAALQYWVQSFHCEHAAIRDMLQDIAIEEFSHLEMVGKLTEPMFGNIQPDSTVNLYYNLSTATLGANSSVQIDNRGPWNSEPNFQYITEPVPNKS